MNQQIKVLLADDHPMFIEGVKNALGKFEHIQVVAECTDGDAVIGYIMNEPVDVAILDVNMPGRNGMDLAMQIHREYAHIKVVFLTMYHPSAIGPEMLGSPYIDGYVLKNSGSLVLCEAIDAVYKGERYLDPKLKDIIELPLRDRLPSTVKLSNREKEIIRLISEGMGNKEIAQKLFLSELTIKTHRKNIYQKLDVNNVGGLLQKVRGLDLS